MMLLLRVLLRVLSKSVPLRMVRRLESLRLLESVLFWCIVKSLLCVVRILTMTLGLADEWVDPFGSFFFCVVGGVDGNNFAFDGKKVLY